MKNQVIQKVVQNHPNSIDRILEQNKNEKYEHLLSNAFVNHLRSLNKSKKFPTMNETLNNIFGDQLNDKIFLEWLVAKLPGGERMNFRKQEEGNSRLRLGKKSMKST